MRESDSKRDLSHYEPQSSLRSLPRRLHIEFASTNAALFLRNKGISGTPSTPLTTPGASIAMLCVAYETLARRGELVALDARDIDFHPDGIGRALIRRGKTDAEGQGRAAYLSRETVRWLKAWLAHAGIREGAVFRRLIGRDQIGGPLNPGSIAPIFKRVAQWIGMPACCVGHVSGHSTRVGAAQDLACFALIPQGFFNRIRD